MTKDEIESALVPKKVEELLDRVVDGLATDYQLSAYNFLVEYLECPEHFTSHEGQRVVCLSLEILHGVKCATSST